jgi:hypothetical protein
MAGHSNSEEEPAGATDVHFRAAAKAMLWGAAHSGEKWKCSEDLFT